jgi:ABC-type multidrug transport system permease subunit
MDTKKSKTDSIFKDAEGQALLLLGIILIAFVGDTSEYTIGKGIETAIFFLFIAFSALYTAHVAKGRVFSNQALKRMEAIRYAIKTSGGLASLYCLIYFNQSYYNFHWAWVAIDSLLVAIPIAWFCSILFGVVAKVVDD